MPSPQGLVIFWGSLQVPSPLDEMHSPQLSGQGSDSVFSTLIFAKRQEFRRTLIRFLPALPTQMTILLPSGFQSESLHRDHRVQEGS